jgi:hypothetical protein
MRLNWCSRWGCWGRSVPGRSVSYRVRLVPSRDLCGTTPEQFGDLLVRLAPLAEQRRRELAERPDRKRAPGAGRRPFPLWLRLLVALAHLR